MDINELFEQNQWWEDRKLIDEDYDILKWNEKKYKWIPELLNKINLTPFALHVILGPRQAGKTTALKLFIKRLLVEHNSRSIFYFNCENIDDYKELENVINLYLDFKAANSIKNSIILLDEITLPKEWYRTIKYLIDIGKFRDDVIVLTGSSSIAVKREVELFPGRRGNGKDYTMLPLSFRGFLNIVDKKLIEKIPAINNIEEIDKKALNAMLFEKELHKYLETYMNYGGYPLSVAYLYESKEEAKKAYLSWIKNAVLKAARSDVIARQIAKVVVETLQSTISWEGLSKKIELKSPKTVAAYIELLSSIFVVNVLHNIDINKKTIRFGKNKKVHFRDPLLLEICEDWGLIKATNKQAAIAEALAVEHLERMFTDNVFFWQDKFEIDVIVQEKQKLYGFEVKYAEKAEAKGVNQLKRFFILTKKEYSKNKLPLAVFLSLLDV